MFTMYEIQKLVERGVLSRELMPTPNYWHWDVLQPENLPPNFKENYRRYREIRYIW